MNVQRKTKVKISQENRKDARRSTQAAALESSLMGNRDLGVDSYAGASKTTDWLAGVCCRSPAWVMRLQLKVEFGKRAVSHANWAYDWCEGGMRHALRLREPIYEYEHTRIEVRLRLCGQDSSVRWRKQYQLSREIPPYSAAHSDGSYSSVPIACQMTLNSN